MICSPPAPLTLQVSCFIHFHSCTVHDRPWQSPLPLPFGLDARIFPIVGVVLCLYQYNESYLDKVINICQCPKKNVTYSIVLLFFLLLFFMMLEIQQITTIYVDDK